MRGAAAGLGSAAFLLPGDRTLRATNPVEERVLALIEPIAAALDYRIVRIRIMGNRRRTLQIMAERLSDGLFAAEDCRVLSRRAVEALEPIEYESLEVSSPGVDRPLMRIEDFQRFVSHEAKVETAAMIEGRRRFKGVIAGVDGDEVRFALVEGGEIRFKMAALQDARLLLTDKLIAEDLKRARAAEAAEASEGKPRGREDDTAPGDRSAPPADNAPTRGGANRTKRKDA